MWNVAHNQDNLSHNEGKYDPNRKTNWLRTKTREMTKEEWILFAIIELTLIAIIVIGKEKPKL